MEGLGFRAEGLEYIEYWVKGLGKLPGMSTIGNERPLLRRSGL